VRNDPTQSQCTLRFIAERVPPPASLAQNGTLTYQVPDFDYTSVTGPWKLEVDGLAGATLKSWSLNIDGTLS